LSPLVKLLAKNWMTTFIYALTAFLFANYFPSMNSTNFLSMMLSLKSKYFFMNLSRSLFGGEKGVTYFIDAI
jgi:hypothetical protein